ncbi:TonB-dependent receptor domain-containing protein [Flavobacterium sp. N1736]|uniref:TonB-dependent receptor domain-containing protein n=1 Tax=Flavobacterium sp. N1736 TaxID=2986823 RepID=UPI0029CAC585|nr:TonB-dependent receptor [Flavobacterium sp. N1736]
MKVSNTKHGYFPLMMKLRDFSFILFLLFSIQSYAQYKISGVVQDDHGNPVSLVEIYNKTTGSKDMSQSDGKFSIEVEKEGEYELVFYKENFSLIEKTVSTSDAQITITLEKVTALSEVVINKQKDKIFALNKLKDIDETAIYAGKKTEVVSLSKITANKAANNARQIYAQVVGLTINESSDGGLQLSIGGRGLDPNRTANFNTRQNGYDISADVLGYPESYYATPTESLEEIQIVRGAASLQYGTQFGGLVNFKIKSPSTKPIEFLTRNTVGSYGLYTNFSSLSGTVGKFSYYTFFNYKQGDGFRPNSHFESKNYFANLNYQFTKNTSIHFDYTYFTYLAQQAGGLTDKMFDEDPTQSNRTRNWFAVNWNLFALRFKHHFEHDADFSLQLFGLDANRKTVGFRDNRVDRPDDLTLPRDLIVGDFINWGAEARYLKKYNIRDNSSAFLIGAKYYQARNTGLQGPGSNGTDADFNLHTDEFPYYANQSDYVYPNLNFSVFGENIFKISSAFSITPGFRYEKIRTKAEGYYRKINLDGAGNVILDKVVEENNVKDRNFFLFGVGLSYKPKSGIEFYGNISQNYRSVTFNDIRSVNANQNISPDITDEKGFTSDIGIRGQLNDKVSFDSSIYALYYNDKIGEYWTENSGGIPIILRDNIGTALTYGFETMIDWNLAKTFMENNDNFLWNVFGNVAITDSEYLKSQAPLVKGNKVEFVPLFNIKSGSRVGYKNFLASVQITYLSEQFTDATNSPATTQGIMAGIAGPIPSYFIADFSASYKWRNWKLEAGITNFTDNSYFTRRATGYPGPGIIPSDPRTFYTTLEFVF